MDVYERSGAIDRRTFEQMDRLNRWEYVRGTQNAVRDMGEEIDSLRSQLRGAVSLSAEELHCLTCAMAGNFPERFQPIRMDLLRKLAKASRAAGGQSTSVASPRKLASTDREEINDG